ncbi:MAG: DUF2934 domain-containing protein [Candidatus Omnitrophica bacterium]|nr:DUF2934 domain-containing protein [Candidatus Omnitrophota bacterium]
MVQIKFNRRVRETKAPSAEEIGKLAYELYLERGGQDGSDFDDWVKAEQILKGKLTRYSN